MNRAQITFFIDIQAHLVLCFLHEKAISYQKMTLSLNKQKLDNLAEFWRLEKEAETLL